MTKKPPPSFYMGRKGDVTYNIKVSIAFINYNSMHSNMKNIYSIHEGIAKNKLEKNHFSSQCEKDVTHYV